MTLYTKAGQAAEEIDNDEAYLTSTELRAFERHVAGLNKLILDVRARYPDAQYYLACSGGAWLNILTGPSHDDGYNPQPRQDRVIESLRLDFADGGDW